MDREKALRDAEVLKRPKIGQVMPNEATIVDHKPKRGFEHGLEYWVLAVREGVEPYVIWTYVAGVEQLANGDYRPCQPYCYSGDYHRELSSALAAWTDIS